MSTPLSVFGKFVYIRAIVNSGRGDLIARLPWFLNGTTSLSKLNTFLIEMNKMNDKKVNLYRKTITILYSNLLFS